MEIFKDYEKIINKLFHRSRQQKVPKCIYRNTLAEKFFLHRFHIPAKWLSAVHSYQGTLPDL